MSRVKIINDFKDYSITEDGIVVSFKRYPNGYSLKPKQDKDGYLTVTLREGNIPYVKKIHRLVAEAFIPNPLNFDMVNHKDNNVRNNNIYNLEWVDNRMNQLHSVSTHNNTLCKKVCQYDNNVLVSTFNSVREVTRLLGYESSYISKVCRGERKQAYGFHWSYE